MAFYELLEDVEQPNSAIFRRLERMANAGDFDDQKTLMGIFQLVAETQTRRQDATGKAMKGIRYTEDVMNLYVILRGRGLSSSAPFAAILGVLGGPSERRIR
jgi:hypothetical protein